MHREFSHPLPPSFSHLLLELELLLLELELLLLELELLLLELEEDGSEDDEVSDGAAVGRLVRELAGEKVRDSVDGLVGMP